MPYRSPSHSTSSQSRNKFVETALSYALTYASTVDHIKITPSSITILADRDYYSYSGPSSSDMPKESDLFVDFNVSLNKAHKTGLGSSAALVTAFTAAVVAHYAPRKFTDMKTSREKYILHNLAQAAHCAAQGKIGSGFDVAAATYGSCIYKRFSPSVLESLGEIGSKDFSDRLQALAEASTSAVVWDTNINKVSGVMIPHGLRLLICDVDCGSETVGMVKKVLQWRKENPEEAQLLWENLHIANQNIMTELFKLGSLHDGQSHDFRNLRAVILSIRSLIREISTRSGVPIEPEVQTELIDSCCQLPGVIGGVVPGAGGFDAVALVVEDKRDVIDSLHRLLDGYLVEGARTGGVNIGKVRLLSVKQDDRGVQKEDLAMYRGWVL